MKEILEALGFPNAYVTKKSKIGDFFAYYEVTQRREGIPEDEITKNINLKLLLVSQKLGIELKLSDYLSEVAKRMDDSRRSL